MAAMLLSCILDASTSMLSTIAFLGYTLRDYNKDIKVFFRTIETVKEGKPLPELEKLSRESLTE